MTDETGIIKNRKVIPRWRPVERTNVSEMLSASKNQPYRSHTDELLKFYYYKWQANQTIANALDVIFYAQMAQDRSLAYGPAEQIYKTPDILPGAKALAEAIRYAKKKNDQSGDVSTELNQQLMFQRNLQKAQEIKARLKEEPGNALLWLELSRFQIGFGNESKAETSIRKALACAPDNRLILRAFSRLLVMTDRADEAHVRLKKSQAVKFDPWVQSAEIAVAAHAGKNPISIKLGRALIQDEHFSEAHFSELSASIGTEDMISGNIKSARKFFRKGLIKPTENTVAQAFFARKELNIELEEHLIKNTPNAFEARANSFIVAKNFQSAYQNCFLWLQDEPFSSDPVIQGTFLASSILDNQQAAIDLFEMGKKANSRNLNMINNGILALAKIGRVQDARNEFLNLRPFAQGEDAEPAYVATRGLIEFRDGNVQAGRGYYEDAVKIAVKLRSPEVEFRAKIHWLMEETEAGSLNPTEVKEKISSLDAMQKEKKDKIGLLTGEAWGVFKRKIEKIIERQKG